MYEKRYFKINGVPFMVWKVPKAYVLSTNGKWVARGTLKYCKACAEHHAKVANAQIS